PAPLALHSFPTRRSSDLSRLLSSRGARLAGGVACRKDDEVGVEVKVENLFEGQETIRAASAEAGQQRRLGGAFGGACGDHAVGRDRKSTRLNSSHDQISY